MLGAPGPYGWDWSSTTHDARGVNLSGREGEDVPALVEEVTRSMRPGIVLPTGKGWQGWTDGLDCFDADGYRLGRVYYGGRDDVHVVSSSAAADLVRERVTDTHVKTARVDTRVDSLADFDDLAVIMEEAAQTYGTETVFVEKRAGDDRKSQGRTLYLGSPSSWVKVRLYEKWLESPGQYEEGTNRLEVQLRPPSRAKAKVSSWTRAETFGATKVTRDLASRIGAEVAAGGTLQKHRGTPDLERTIEAMGTQYGKAVRKWLTVSGGDLGTVLDRLGVAD
jgi:hypothetical protein